VTPTLTLADSTQDAAALPTGAEHDEAFAVWADRRDRRLRAAHRSWLEDGGPLVGLVDLVADALSDTPWTRDDVIDWVAHAHSLTGCAPKVTAASLVRLARVDAVPNAALRDVYTATIRSGTSTPARIARRAGFANAKGRADVSGLERALGLRAQNGSVRLWIGYEPAVHLARVLDVEPHAAGV
jgi:hypothetical protein